MSRLNRQVSPTGKWPTWEAKNGKDSLWGDIWDVSADKEPGEHRGL